MTNLKYIIQADSIIVFDGTQTQVISAQNQVMYSELRKLLESGSFIQANNYSTYSNYIKSEFPGLEKIGNTYYYEGTCLGFLTNTVGEFIKKGLPLTALLKFVAKTEELEMGLREKVRLAVDKGNYPITWEGDIVAYKRSSWNAGDMQAPEFNNASEFRAAYAEFKQKTEDIFVPGQYVVPSGNNTLLASSFDWVSNSCPDTGAFYDVEVKVKDIVSVSQNNILTKGYTNLSKLSETYVEDRSAVTGSLMQVWLGTNQYGEKVIIKQPHNRETAKNYLAEINNGAKVNNSYLPVSIKQVVSC